MAGRNRYKELIANTLYERTSLDKTVYQLQKSWKEAEQSLNIFEKQFAQKLFGKQEAESKKNKK